jgi:two-component system CheB/CheR fusion protein
VTLEAGGLAGALRELCGKLEETFHVSCIFDCDSLVLVHDNTAATHLYRIAQEAISNAIKHGKAKTIIIELALTDRELTLKVRDDGIGFSSANLGGSGIGMHSMAYRARLIGGTLDIQNGARGGTVVTCTIHDISAAKEIRDANKKIEEPTGSASQTRTRARGGKEKGVGHRRSSYRSRAPGRAH